MESGRRPEQNTGTAVESEEPRYERQRSVSGPEHQYCAPGTPKHQYTRYTNAPSTPKPGRVAVNQVHQNQYTNTSTVCQVEIAVYRASAQCIKYTKTNSPIHQYQYTNTSTPKPITPMHQNQYQTLCIARLVECGRLLPRQDCLHHRGHWVHGQGGRLKINIILI